MPGVDNPQAWNRYALTFNSPLNYTDPSGNNPECGPDGIFCDMDDTNDNDYAPMSIPLPSTPTIPLDPITDEEEEPESPPPPNQMTNGEKIGMGVTVALTEVLIILPIEAALLYGTIDAAVACGLGQVEFCVADIFFAAIDIVVADFQVSLMLHTYNSISSGQIQEFDWTIIPAIFAMFEKDEE